MSYFDTSNGQTTMEVIAISLERIAKSLEENNKLMAKAIQAEEGAKHLDSSSTPAKSKPEVPPKIV